MEGRIQ